jgi:hypothetical protein
MSAGVIGPRCQPYDGSGVKGSRTGKVRSLSRVAYMKWYMMSNRECIVHSRRQYISRQLSLDQYMTCRCHTSAGISKPILNRDELPRRDGIPHFSNP